METNQPLDSIKKKIRMLLEKTPENGCSLAEAESALRKAQELMTKHFIAIHDLGQEQEKISFCLKKTTLIKVPFASQMFFASLSELFDCEYYYTKKEIAFFGYSDDAEMCVHFYQVIVRALIFEKQQYKDSLKYRTLKRLHNPNKLSFEFTQGFVAQISIKLNDLQKERKSKFTGSYGIALYNKNEAIRKAFLEDNSDIKTQKIKFKKPETEAFIHGVIQAEKTGLFQSLNSRETTTTYHLN